MASHVAVQLNDVGDDKGFSSSAAAAGIVAGAGLNLPHAVASASMQWRMLQSRLDFGTTVGTGAGECSGLATLSRQMRGSAMD